MSTQVNVRVYPCEGAEMDAVFCWHLDWQVSSVAQISNSLGQMFSTVEYLTLGQNAHDQPCEEHNELFRNLQMDGEKFPLEPLPEVQ